MIKFSVVIPIYNSARTIRQTINSCLNQIYKPFEIIIVDDCSTDNSIEIVDEYLKDNYVYLIVNKSNLGVSSSRNIGWDRATGDYVAFLDSDDLWNLQKLSIINYILSKDNPPYLIGHSYTHDLQEFKQDPFKLELQKLKFSHLVIRNYFNGSSIIIRNEKQFRFNENFRYTEDHELILRVSFFKSVTFLKNCYTLLGRPQLSIGGLSESKFKMRVGEIKMYLYAVKYNYSFAILLPFFILFSIIKHFRKLLNA